MVMGGGKKKKSKNRNKVYYDFFSLVEGLRRKCAVIIPALYLAIVCALYIPSALLFAPLISSVISPSGSPRAPT